MIWDIDDLLNELGLGLAWTFNELEQGREVKTHRVIGDDVVKISTTVSIRTATPDAFAGKPPEREPLVDVFEDDKRLRVVVELPGVRKEDVQVSFMDGILRIEVSKDGRVHRRDVPCKVRPGSVVVKSTTQNNSVVEITFLRTQGSGKK